jgi:hypothetical protein
MNRETKPGAQIRWVVVAAGLLFGVTLGTATAGHAHEQRRQDDHVFVVGWLLEPTFVGYPNAVSFEVSHGDEPAKGRFKVEIMFGGKNSDERTQPLPLDPVAGDPGHYQAAIIPTRPGTYTFHIFGRLEDGDKVDEYFTSGKGTFHQPENPAALQFPAEDPTAGELAQRLERMDARLVSLQDSVESIGGAGDDAAELGPDPLATGGIILGGLALIGFGITWAQGRKKTT